MIPVNERQTALILSKDEFAFLSDFNFDKIDGVVIGPCHEDCVPTIRGERTALYDFAEMLDDEKTMMHELHLVRRMAGRIKEAAAADIDGIDPAQFE